MGININEHHILDMEFSYFAKFSFELQMPSCKVGKEGIYMTLDSLIKKKESNGIPIFRWVGIEDKVDSIECRYSNMPFANLFFSEELSVRDSGIFFGYTEKTDQQLMLPNLLFFVNMLIGAIKTSETINDGFEKHSVNCHIRVENNGDCYFYEKYSPLAVDYSRMLKYGIAKEVDFEVDIEARNDLYLLVNHFYQQYKCPQSIEKPFVTVDKNNFWQYYGEL